MAALQHVDKPGYAALLLRRTYADLSLPGALMNRAQDWFNGTGARWHEKEKTWAFPSGATITFGYLETERDKYRYQGAEFQFLGFDELTQFSETQYRYLLSRGRRLKGVEIPLRARGASNPGGVGHAWVQQRFITEGEAAGRVFVPAKLADNPHLDADEYRLMLAELDPITRQQLLDGDWTARHLLGFFRREWFQVEKRAPEGLRWVRFWDCAAKAKQQNDFWAGAKVATAPQGHLWIANVVHGKWEYPDGKQVVKQTAKADGPGVTVGVEDTSSGTAVVQDLLREKDMAGFTIRAVPVTLDKAVRAGPWAARAQGGLVHLVEGAWVGGFLDEAEAFPTEGIHDDQVDAVSGAFGMVSRQREIWAV